MCVCALCVYCSSLRYDCGLPRPRSRLRCGGTASHLNQPGGKVHENRAKQRTDPRSPPSLPSPCTVSAAVQPAPGNPPRRQNLRRTRSPAPASPPAFGPNPPPPCRRPVLLLAQPSIAAEPAAAQPWPPETCRRQALPVRSSTCILARAISSAPHPSSDFVEDRFGLSQLFSGALVQSLPS